MSKRRATTIAGVIIVPGLLALYFGPLAIADRQERTVPGNDATAQLDGR